MPRILIAPDSFKGTFTSAQVADAIARGLEREGFSADRCAVADGGEGTLDALLAASDARLVPVPTTDPLGRAIDGQIALSGDGRTAIVETATASGLALVAPEERDPWAASTTGTGTLIAAAVEAGAAEILLGVGGSATTDGGLGAVEAIVAAGGLRGARLTVLCDVRTPFEDAARVFAPQKGADPEAVEALTARLRRLAATWPRDPCGVPFTGCAGGLSGGLWAACDAALVPGAARVLDAVGFDERLVRADAVVTGEGRLDDQTLHGKLIGELAGRAARAGVPVHVIAGSSTLPPDRWSELGVAGVRIASTETELTAAGAALARDLAAVRLPD